LTDLPAIGDVVDLVLGSGFFPIKGKVFHSEYADSIGGTTISIGVQDRRTDLDSTVLFTDDIGDNASLYSKGIISVAATFREDGRAGNEYKEYSRIHEEGATYYDIYRAATISPTPYASGFNPNNIFPDPTRLIANIPSLGSVEDKGVLLANYRWKFNGDTIKNALSSILDDLGFDWYWDMTQDKVKLINRSQTFEIDSDNVPSAADTAEKISVKIGLDDTEANNNYMLFGAQQEGFIDSLLLSPIDGLNTPSGIVFNKAWDNLTMGFIDAQGIYRTYRVLEKELRMALRSIEHWTYYKRYQVSRWGDAEDNGTIAAQHPDFRSRLDPLENPDNSDGLNAAGMFRVITNRRLDQNWILNWYEKVHQFATNNFGRTYVAEKILGDNVNGKFDIVNAAWCNLENQLDPSYSEFINGYKINSLYGAVAPFVNKDLRVSAYVVLPGVTLYGLDGSASPAQFESWNEDPDGIQSGITGSGLHYVPVSLQEVSDIIEDPRDPTDPFIRFAPGSVICQFPAIAISGVYQDPILQTLQPIIDMNFNVGSGVLDILNLDILPIPYSTLTGQVAIPIKSSKRYGTGFPSYWTSDPSGLLDNPRRRSTVDERFGPWNFTPGPNLDNNATLGTSVQYMNRVAKNLIEAKARFSEKITFGEVVKVGFPVVSFNDFADENGLTINGITGISTQVSTNGFTTSYSLKSHFDEFGDKAPLGIERRGIVEGIIHPITYTEFQNKKRDISIASFIPEDSPKEPKLFSINPDEPLKTLEVIITHIEASSTDPNSLLTERYGGRILESNDSAEIVDSGKVVPPGFLTNGRHARCIDGFLDVGDICKYTGGRLAGRRIYFFSGGKTLSEGFIARVRSVSTTVDSNDKPINVVTVDFERSKTNETGSNHPYLTASIPLPNVPIAEGQDIPEIDEQIRIELSPKGNTGAFTQNSFYYNAWFKKLIALTGKLLTRPVAVTEIQSSEASDTAYAIVAVAPVDNKQPGGIDITNEIRDVRVLGFNQDITGSIDFLTQGILSKNSQDGKYYFMASSIGTAKAVRIVSVEDAAASTTNYAKVTVKPISKLSAGGEITDVRVLGFTSNITLSLPILTEGILATDPNDGKNYFLTNKMAFGF
jgi:hypothetical protein